MGDILIKSYIDILLYVSNDLYIYIEMYLCPFIFWSIVICVSIRDSFLVVLCVRCGSPLYIQKCKDTSFWFHSELPWNQVLNGFAIKRLRYYAIQGIHYEPNESEKSMKIFLVSPKTFIWLLTYIYISFVFEFGTQTILLIIVYLEIP